VWDTRPCPGPLATGYIISCHAGAYPADQVILVSGDLSNCNALVAGLQSDLVGSVQTTAPAPTSATSTLSLPPWTGGLCEAIGLTTLSTSVSEVCESGSTFCMVAVVNQFKIDKTSRKVVSTPGADNTGANSCTAFCYAHNLICDAAWERTTEGRTDLVNINNHVQVGCSKVALNSTNNTNRWSFINGSMTQPQQCDAPTGKYSVCQCSLPENEPPGKHS
jgi:hypothetical protein